ncbi:MAG: hypothetical protein EOP10_11095 [Proteobacteria bacterium]|nr:MAG: hypothetical protein EOP10_11095 [Pseudomonadota bacterium]
MKSVLILVLALMFACSKAAEIAPTVKAKSDTKSGDSTSENGDKPSLTLSWKSAPEMSSYHIFYVDAKKKTREIDAVLKGDDTFDDGKMIIDQTNMEAWPKVGEKACFYVVADDDGLKSDPSSQACLILK